MDYFADVRERLGLQRGQIGALQSRADIAVANLGVSREEMTAAGSRITDVDMAEETANLVRQQILQQTGRRVVSSGQPTKSDCAWLDSWDLAAKSFE